MPSMSAIPDANGDAAENNDFIVCFKCATKPTRRFAGTAPQIKPQR
jgi:hypothetical protein